MAAAIFSFMPSRTTWCLPRIAVSDRSSCSGSNWASSSMPGIWNAPMRRTYGARMFPRLAAIAALRSFSFCRALGNATSWKTPATSTQLISRVLGTIPPLKRDEPPSFDSVDATLMPRPVLPPPLLLALPCAACDRDRDRGRLDCSYPPYGELAIASGFQSNGSDLWWDSYRFQLDAAEKPVPGGQGGSARELRLRRDDPRE
mmetsp:Transcript_26236/g.73208  ORF Transcript_26236/g.73208 Transcript_26236/m.73208 type:complete len:202 (-) Transcript_26236:4952-5557(-)